MKAQTIFNTVVRHLAMQGKRAAVTRVNGQVSLCKYRKGAMKCAVGCLIKDDEYDKRMEGLSVEVIKDTYLPKRLRPHLELLQALQQTHDNTSGDIKSMLRRTAEAFDLSTSVLNKLTFPEVWK
jgi:hypothetical protein